MVIKVDKKYVDYAFNEMLEDIKYLKIATFLLEERNAIK